MRLILSFSLLISVFSNSFITNAEETEYQEGYYTYTVFNDEAVITDCDTSISGDITIPNNFGMYTVTGISRDAFYGCNNIKSIKIPYYITGIADGAFEYCDSLTDISVSPHNSNYSSEDGILLNKSGTKILCCPKSKSGIVNVPYRVTYLRNEFNNRQNITQINISAKCTDIGAKSFEGCSSLVSVTVNKNNTSLSSKDGVLFNKDGTSLNACLNSKSGTYYVPDGVEEIGFCAFYGCEKLTSVIIPDTVKSISSFSFDNCNNLTTISVSPNNKMFSSINGVLLNKNKTEVLLCPKGKKGILDIPDGVTNIEEDALIGCNGITQITVPSSIKNIDIDLFRCPFRDCENLTDISVSANNQNYSSINGALFNKEKTILLLCPQGKTGVYSVPNGVKEIEDDAFEGCKITEIEIPDSITSIGNFYNSNLINVTVSSNNMCYSSIN